MIQHTLERIRQWLAEPIRIPFSKPYASREASRSRSIPRRLAFAIIGAVLLAVLALSVLLVWKWTSDDIDEGRVKQALPPGSTVSQITSFLDSEHMAHGPVEHADVILQQEFGLTGSTPVIQATVPVERTTCWPLENFTQIIFILDNEERLVRFVLQKSCISL